MARSIRTLLLFVDGLGLGPHDPDRNPIVGGACPHLARLLRTQAVPIDAGLGVPGLPQSATGQAALLTGLNAPALMGRHMEGLPGPRLKQLIRDHNLFSHLMARGYRATFANAYFTDDVQEVKSRRHQSVTTVAALQAFGTVRNTAALLRNQAVYQDLTRHVLRGRGYAGPTVTPSEAGRHLVAIARAHDFTLFEYFQTDRVGHAGHQDAVRHILAQLEEFLEVLLEFPRRRGHLFVLTSDHGNMEDLTTRGHTNNPVPFVALGTGAQSLRRRVRSLLDVTPALLDLYPERATASPRK